MRSRSRLAGSWHSSPSTGRGVHTGNNRPGTRGESPLHAQRQAGRYHRREQRNGVGPRLSTHSGPNWRFKLRQRNEKKQNGRMGCEGGESGRLEQLGKAAWRGGLVLGFEAKGLEKQRVYEKCSRLGHGSHRGLGLGVVGKDGSPGKRRGQRGGAGEALEGRQRSRTDETGQSNHGRQRSPTERQPGDKWPWQWELGGQGLWRPSWGGS